MKQAILQRYYLKREARAIILCSLLLAALFPACRLQEDPVAKDRDPSSECQILLTYDAVTTTVIRPENMADSALLSTLDRAFSMPKRDRQLLSACIASDGTYVIETEFAAPPNPIQYPANNAAAWLEPQYKKVVNQNGQLSYYNGLNELINTDVIDNYTTDVFEVLNLFNQLKTLPSITDQDFSDAMDLISSNGLNLTNHGNNIATAKVIQPDGSASVLVIDKAARMQVGQLNFSPNGKLDNLFMFKVEGKAPNVTLKKGMRVFYFDAVESNVRMEHRTITEYNSFTLTLN